MRACWNLLTLLLCASLPHLVPIAAANDVSDASVNIELDANWSQTPFKLNVIESIASINESLYEPLVLKLLDISADYENGEFTMSEEEESDYAEISDSDFYNYAISLLPSDVDKYLANIHLSNNFASPRIQAHYNYYNINVKNNHDCDRDVILVDPLIMENYCDSEAAFMLQTNDYASVFDDIKTPMDRRLGSHITPKTYIIYGDYRDAYFRKMFYNTYQSAGTGKFNLIWRYVNTSQGEEAQKLSGYGAALNLKRTDYIVIDDRGLSDEQQRKLQLNESTIENEKLSSALYQSEDILTITPSDIKKVFDSDVKSLALKFTHFINTSNKKLQSLTKLISEFPKYAHYISRLDYSEEDLADTKIGAIEAKDSHLPNGIYINNALVPQEKTDIFEIINTIKRELSFLNLFKTIGFAHQNARTIMTQFADAMINLFINPSSRYDLSAFNRTIVYLNDIEFEKRYEDFEDPKVAYTKRPAAGQLPKARENIHQLIFALDITDSKQLPYLIEFTNQIITQKVPIQIGVIPFLGTSRWNDKAVSKLFGTFHERGPEEAFYYLTMLNRFVNSPEPLTLMTFRALDYPYLDDSLYERYTGNLENLYSTFGLTKELPSIFANGIIYNFNEIGNALNQLFQDMVILASSLHQNEISSKSRLSKYLRKDAVSLRDPLLVPDEISHFKKSFIEPPTFISAKHWQAIDSLRIVKDVKRNEAMVTINLTGSFLDESYINQVAEILKYSMKARGVKIVVSDVHATHDFKKLLAIKDIKEQIEFVEKLSYSSINDDYEVKDSIRTVNEMFGFDYRENESSKIVLAGRVISAKSIITADKLASIVKYERSSRLSTLKKLYKEHKPLATFKDEFDNFENFAWIVSYSYFFPVSDSTLASGIPRISLNSLSKQNVIVKQVTPDDELLDVHIVLDPVSEKGQELVSFIPLFENSSFISLNVHMMPIPELQEVPIKRFYKGLIRTDPVTSPSAITFDNVPEKTLFNVGLNEPQRWLVSIKNATTDLDNLKLDLTSTNSAFGVFELKNILVEGYASYYNGIHAHSPGGLPLEITNGLTTLDTNVMTNLGYFQLKANPGIWDISIKSMTRGSLVYQLPEELKVGIVDLDGAVITPVFEKQWGMETISLVEAIEDSENEESLIAKKYLDVATYFFNLYNRFVRKQADINIFTVASGHLYERFLGIMIASVMKHTDHTVKFWLIENFMSPKLKKDLHALQAEYGFEYELVMYKWPSWLREQRERQRTIWGYKILFLDVLFPQDLEKVIFVDSDQIVRTDLMELVDMDIDGAPYAYTPMCDSRKEMEGFRFWKTGYWQSLLGDKFQYHISALYVVDLLRFREIAAGDILRHHYQQLSYDPTSLSNLDQDLPNNLQSILKIHSLPQEWLWCETWCSDESLEKAKTIDLCNNPLTKEPKLDRARRQVKEWTQLDDEVAAVILGASTHTEDIKHDEL